MQCMPSFVATTTTPVADPDQGLTLDALTDAFALVPDPRRQGSIAYTLPAILALAIAAILANQHSVLAIAEWGARQSPDLLTRLGFPNGRTPCQSTLQRLFAKLDGHVLSQTLTGYFATTAAPDPAAPCLQGVAIDGKAQRGRLQYQPGSCPVHALTAYCHDHGIVLAHEPIEPGLDKAEAELTVAPTLIERIDWHGRVLTGDALFCQRSLCRQVTAAGGDYLLLVRENQPTLYQAIALLFDPPPGSDPLPLVDRREARTLERGHGRTQEVRHLVASTDLTAYLRDEFGWSGLAQVFRLEHTWQEHGEAKRHLHYGITSVDHVVGLPASLLMLKRGHWGIENRLHRVKDVTFGEDQSLIHVGQGPTVMALVRETAVSLLHRAGITSIAKTLRRHSQYPEEAVNLVLNHYPARA